MAARVIGQPLIIASHRDNVYGVYSDLNRAKRAMKQKAPHVYKRVKYLPMELNDGIVTDSVEAGTLEDWMGQGE